MRLWGYNISGQHVDGRVGLTISKAAKDNKFTRFNLWPFQHGRPLLNPTDQLALLNAFKSLAYVCGSRNAAAFASTPLGLFVAKRTTTQKILAPTRPISKKMKAYFDQTPNISMMPQYKAAAEIEEITEHRLIDMFQRVNPFMNRFTLFEISDIFLELTGNCYWYLVKDALGIPVEIWPIPPDRMEVVPDPEEFISHYVFRTGLSQKKRFELDEIIHFKWPNPTNQYYGMSPLQAVADAYNINMNMFNFENALLKNNARPEGFFSTEEELGDNEFDRLKEELAEFYNGITNNGRSGVLDHGVTYQAITMKPKDLSFIQGYKRIKTEIYEAFDNPEGLFDLSANRANAEAAAATFAKLSTFPRHRRFEETLNERLVPMYDEKLFVAFDNVIQEDKEFKLKEDTELIKAAVISGNEVREERHMEPMPGLEEPLVSRSLVPLSRLGEVSNSGNPMPGGEDEDEDKAIAEMARSIVDGIAERL